MSYNPHQKKFYPNPNKERVEAFIVVPELSPTNDLNEARARIKEFFQLHYPQVNVYFGKGQNPKMVSFQIYKLDAPEFIRKLKLRQIWGLEPFDRDAAAAANQARRAGPPPLQEIPFPELKRFRDEFDALLSVAIPAELDPLYVRVNPGEPIPDVRQLLATDHVVYMPNVFGSGQNRLEWSVDSLVDNGVIISGQQTVNVQDSFGYAAKIAYEERTGRIWQKDYHEDMTWDAFFDKANNRTSASPQVLNILDHPYPQSEVPEAARRIDLETLILPTLPRSRSERVQSDSICKHSWFIISLIFAWSYWHHDAGGLDTWIWLRLGWKVWLYVRLSDVAKDMRDKNPTQFPEWLKDIKNIGLIGQVYRLDLFANSLFLQPGGLWHAVYTAWDTIMHGGHGVGPNFIRMKQVMILEALAGQWTTNAEHSSWLYTLLVIARALRQPAVRSLFPDQQIAALAAILDAPGVHMPQVDEKKDHGERRRFSNAAAAAKLQIAGKGGKGKSRGDPVVAQEDAELVAMFAQAYTVLSEIVPPPKVTRIKVKELKRR